MVLESVDFVSFISWFEGIGGFDIILPFILIFALSFAVLDKVQIFGKKNVNVIIAIILGFFLVIQRDIVVILQGFLPRISMLVLTLIMILLVAGALGFTELGSGWKSLSVIIAIVGVLWALGASVGWNVPALDLFSDQDIAILLIIGVFVLVIWFIIRDGGSGDSGGFSGFMDKFNNLFGASKRGGGGDSG